MAEPKNNNPWEQFLAENNTPPVKPVREKNWFDKSVQGVVDFVPAMGLGAFRAVAKETPATATVGAGAIARGVAEGSDNPFQGLLGLSGADKYLSTTNPVLGLAADLGTRFVDQNLADPLSEQAKGGLRDFANRQFVRAEEGRRQYDIDNPTDAKMSGNLGYQFGQSLGQMGVALGAGLATGAVTRNPGLAQAATMGTMGAQNLASNISAQQQVRGIDTDIDLTAATRGAVAQTGVDMLLGRFLGADDITRAMAGGTFGKAITRGARAGGLKGAREEGIAEVLQQSIERGQAGLDINPVTSEGARDEYGQAFVMGAALGGGMGAVSGAYSAAIDQKNANDPNRAFNNRESIGAEGRLKALMDEQAANQAYNQLNPSPFTTLGEQLTAGGEFDNQRLANEIADARDAARLIEERKQGEFLQLPAPDPMKYDPSGVSGRPATQEEILMAQQTGGAPNVAPVLALPNPNVEPIVVDPTGVAQRTDEPLRVEQERAQEAIVSPDRDVQAAALVQQAATTKRTQSEPASPYDAKAMLTVRGKPAYTVTVVGPGSKPNTVRVFNNDTRTMAEVPRSRIASVTEARDPKVLNRLPPDIRRAEDARAKDLHQKQIEAIINPQSATEAVPPPADTVEPTQDLGVPPPTVAPDVQGEGSFVGQAPVAEIPQTIEPAVNVTSKVDQQAPITDAPVELPPQQTPVAEMPQPFDATVSQPETVSPTPAVDTPPPISTPPAEEVSPYTPRQGLNVVEDAAEKAGPSGALRQLAERNPKYAPIANAVADRIEELQAVGATITLNIAGPGDPVPTRMVRNRDTFGMSMPDATNRRNDVYVAADSLGRYTNGSFDFDQVLLHEMIHAVTLAQIKSVFDQKVAGTVPSQGVKDLLSLFNEVVTHFNKRVKAGNLSETEVNLLGRRNQGLKDIYEFVAWGMTNPEFQQYLDTIPYSKTPRSMFSEFVNAVRAALGIPAKEKSTLTGLIRTFDKMMAEPAANVDRNMLRMQTALGRVADAQNQAAQATAGPAITNPDGPELAAAAEPMSTTDDDAVFAIQQVEQATLDPNFRSQVVIALREEFRKLGFGANIPLALEFTDAAGAAAMLKTQNGKQTIVIALGLANNTRDVPGAVQAMRPFLTHEVVEFAMQHEGLLKPEERTVLLDYAKNHKGADGKTLYETVVERYGVLAKANNQPEAYLEREAVAYAAEYLTRLNPQKWGDSPQNPAAKRNRGSAATRNLRRLKSAPTAETKAATGFKDRLAAFGKALFKGLEKAYPAKTADGGTLAQDIALRLAKGDIAHRARTNPRFAQEVKFAGWAVPPAEAQQIGKQLRSYLDSMGLPDVGLRLSTAILDFDGKAWTAAAPEARGSYFARTITISMASYDPDLTVEQNLENLIKVVDHEAVHALRATGAWTPSQWLNLVKFVRMAKDPATGETYFEKASRMYGAEARKASPAVAQDVLNEEAVAMAFADNFDINIPRATGPQRLLDKIAQTHMGVASAMYNMGIKSPETIIANGAQTFEAVRAGQAAQQRRELGASSPAEMSVKFALAESKTANINPAMDPDPEPVSVLEKLFDASFRTRNPLKAYKNVSDRIEDVTSWTQTKRSLMLRIPFLGGMLDPRASMADPGLFTLLRSRTLGDIQDQNAYISDLKLKAEKIIGSDAKLEKAVRDYITTKNADPSMIPDARLADIVAEMKTMVSTVGRNLVDLGLLSRESFEAMDGSYLHRRYLDSTKTLFSTTRLVYGDLGFLKERTNPNIAERAAKGEEVDTLTSVTAYLAKATHAMYISNMHQTMLGVSALEDPNVRHWVVGAEDTIMWNGKRNSPFAVEAEIDGNLQSIQDLQANLGLSKKPETAAKNKAKLDKATMQVAGKARVLLRNKLWLGRKGANPAQIVDALGIQLSKNGTVPEDALTNVPDAQIIQLFSQIRSGGINFSDVQRSVVWREKVWSVLDMEREIARIEEDVYAATEPTGPDDTMRADRLRMAKDSVRTGKIQLMRNTLWQNLRQVNPDEVVAELGDFSEDAVNQAYDNLRMRHALFNYTGAKDGVFGRALEILKSYAPGMSALSDNVVQVPDTPRWGALRGMLMAREVYDIMNGTGSVIENVVDDQNVAGKEGVTMPRLIQQMMAVFKGSSTVLNPGTHLTNWVGNIIQGSMYGGVDPANWMKHIGFALGEVLNADGDAYNALRERGGARGSNSLADVSLVTDPMRTSMERAAREVLQNFDMESLKNDPGKVAKAFLKYGQDLGKAGYTRAADFYQLSDTVMKVALMRCHLQRGLTADEAFLNAQDVFFDYGIVPPFVRAARNLPFIGSPFLSWTYMATALTINSLGSSTVLRRFDDGTELSLPNVAFMAPWILMYAGVQAANMAADDMEDEDRKYLIAGLPDFAKKGFGFMYSGIDAGGRPVMLDISKYTSFGTLLKVLGTGDEMQGASGNTGIPAVLKELGFLGSDPGFQIVDAVLERTRSGKPDTKAGSEGFENTPSILTKVTDIFLPPLLRGLGNGTNPIVGTTGLLRSTPVEDNGILPYQGKRPALSFWQKAARIGGFGVYVIDVVPSLENRVKQANTLVGKIKTETREIVNDAYMTEEQKAAALGKLEVRAERVLTRAAEAKALLEEAQGSEFYRKYRENVIAMGLPDPVVSNAENKKVRNERISAQEYEALWRAAGIDVPEN